MADIREQLLAAFEVEYREHLDAIKGALDRVRSGEAVNVREIFRRAHSLKGAARAVDLPEIEEAAHAMETLFADVMEKGGQVDAALAARVEPQLDIIERRTAVLYARPSDKVEAVAAPAAPIREFLRVDAIRVRQLSGAMHDLSASLDQLESQGEDFADLQVRAEALARMLEQPAARHDTARLAQEARAVSRGLRAAWGRYTEVSRGSAIAGGRLRDEIERISLVSASTVFAGLDTMLRDLAEESGKRIDIRIEGLDTQADRLLLQTLRDPVIHLLRNAIVHGMEEPIDRHSLGKPERGEIGLKVLAKAGRLELSVFDDGRGPDLRRIEDVAVRRNMLPSRSEQEAPPSAERLLALIFEPGFSTAESVDRVAGRGIGLSVVAEAARRAGGGAFMRRRTPYGAEVVISTPLSASRQSVLLAFEGEQLYGLPTRAVERVLHVASETLERLDGRQVLKLDEGANKVVVPVISLGSVLGAAGTEARDSGVLDIAIMRLGDQRLGIRVDSFSDVRTTTVAALTHPYVDELVLGAVQLERDEVGIVINPEALMRRYARNEVGSRAAQPKAPMATKAKTRTILIVDDSVTTRTLEKSILEANGFKVILAVDGVDALDRLRSSGAVVDLIVADVEMPRMDGFQLLAALKGDAAFSRVPVIMMTSRARPEDIQRGMELGADAYLVKQTFDQRELLATIGQLI